MYFFTCPKLNFLNLFGIKIIHFNQISALRKVFSRDFIFATALLYVEQKRPSLLQRVKNMSQK